MLVCLACSKQATLDSSAVDDNDNIVSNNNNAVDVDGSCRSSVQSPTKSEHIKSFTTQLKDIVMRFSIGAYKHCRPCSSSREAAMATSGAIDQKAGGNKYNEQLNLLEIENERILMLAGMRNSRRSTESVDDELYDTENRADQRLLEAMQEELGLGLAELERKESDLYVDSEYGNREAILPGPSNPRRCHRHRLKKDRSCRKKSMSSGPAEVKKQCRNDDVQHNFDDSDEQGLLNNVQKDENEDGDNDKKNYAEITETTDEEAEEGNEGKLGRGKDYEEWVAQVEPGVMIVFVALPDGCNYLKRIRYSRELFNKSQAQQWWAENCDMVHELYSVTKADAPCCDSTRSSCVSTTSCSSCCSSQRNVLRNTLEVLSPKDCGSYPRESNIDIITPLEIPDPSIIQHNALSQNETFDPSTPPQLKEKKEALFNEVVKPQMKEKDEDHHKELVKNNNSLNNYIHHNNINEHISNDVNEDRELKRVRVLLC